MDINTFLPGQPGLKWNWTCPPQLFSTSPCFSIVQPRDFQESRLSLGVASFLALTQQMHLSLLTSSRLRISLFYFLSSSHLVQIEDGGSLEIGSWECTFEGRAEILLTGS